MPAGQQVLSPQLISVTVHELLHKLVPVRQVVPVGNRADMLYHLADHLPIIYILIITFFFEAPGKAIFAQKTILIILFGSLGYPKYTIKLL